MIGKFLGKLFGAPAENSGGGVVASETYRDFQIHATPVNEANGWRVTGVIVKTIDGEEKSHRFIRADTCADVDGAAAMTLRKAKQLIDERGDSLFN
jgi:hypothetical protein